MPGGGAQPSLPSAGGAGAGAGVIHTDFERGYICAEVMKFAGLVEHGYLQG